MRLSTKQVKQIQTELKQAGLYKYKIDGDYGRGTRKALRQFQKANGLIADGIYGRQTRAIMFGGRAVSRKRKNKELSNYKPNNEVCKQKFPEEKYRKAMDAFYGKPSQSGNNIKIYKTPYPLYYGEIKVTRISLNKYCAKEILQFFSDLLSYYGAKEIKRLGLNKYSGSFNYRLKRGSKSSISTHAYGCAIDLNAGENRMKWRRKKALFAKKEYEPMIKIAEANGLYSLGYSRGFDYMHLQCCWR